MSGRAWGQNTTRGRLGTGIADALTYTTPQLMASAVTFVEFSAAALSTGIGRTDTGLVYAWGSNQFAGLGNGATDLLAHATPVQVSGVSSIVKARGGSGSGHILALDASGNLYGWGRQLNGEFGIGNTTTQLVPILIATGVLDIAAGANFSVIMKSGGVVQTAGINARGQLGTGNTTNQTSWQTVTPATGTVVAVRAGQETTALLFADGSVKGWGYSQRGQLGNTNATNTALITIPISGVIEVGEGGRTFYFLLSDHTVWAIGDNNSSALGVGVTFATLGLSTTALQQTWPAGVYPIQFGTYADSGILTGLAVGADNRLFTWGDGLAGQMGDGNFYAEVSNPVVLNPLVYVTACGGGIPGVFSDALDAAPAVRRGRSWAAVIG